MAYELDELIAMGQRNLEIIHLASNWCGHIKFDKGGMGVGIPESITGLPISGGTFRCDHARGRSPSGMQLANIALDFYQRNCIDCSSRIPMVSLNNLGTWAEGLIEEQRNAAKRFSEEVAIREQERQVRHRNRRIAIGEPDALVQSILNLVERIDAEKSDSDAAEELLALAELNPSAFSNELLGALLFDAQVCRLSPLLEAVIKVYESDARPSLDNIKTVAVLAIADGWAGVGAIELLEENVEFRDFEHITNFFPAAVSLAGPRAFFHRAPEAYSGIVSRLYTLNPVYTCELLSFELMHGDDRRRISAAKTSAEIIEKDLESAGLLLSALLDALKMQDQSKYGPEEEASSEIADVVAIVFQKKPVMVEEAINQRWKRGSVEYRQALLRCYDAAVRRELFAELGPELVTIVAKRALDASFDHSNEELVRHASDILDLVVKYHGEIIGISPSILLGALAVFVEQKDQLLSERSNIRSGIKLNEASFLDMMTMDLRLDGTIRSVIDALVSISRPQTAEFWEAFGQVWDKSDTSPSLRLALVGIAGKCAQAYSTLPKALPYLYTALMGVDVGCRASALRALAEVEWNDPSQIPEDISIGVLLALDDQYLVVVSAAVKAVSNVTVPSQKKVQVIVRLLNIARAYAGERRQSDLVVEAIKNTLAIVDESVNHEAIREYSLATIASMPRFEAARAILRHSFRTLRDDPNWLSIAIELLEPDDDPNYGSLGFDDRKSILNEILKYPRESLENFVPRLIEIASLSLKRRDYRWAWMIADVLSIHGFFSEALEICEKVVLSVPDTLERRPFRLSAQLAAENQRFEVAVKSGNVELRKKVSESSARLIDLARKDEEENGSARSPFVPRTSAD